MKLFNFLALSVVLFSCVKPSTDLQPGSWRGVITLQGQDLPFNFDLTKDSGRFQVFLKNGDERLLLNEVKVEGDSVTMVMHIFDAALHAKIEDHHLTGFFVKNYAPDYKFPFSATFGDTYRFEKPAAAAVDFTGKYSVKFFDGKYTALSVGIFQQKENHVTGTFLNPDGDYRYLEGNVVDGKMKLSAFDGNHAYIFTATKSGDTLKGDFFAGKDSHATWTGIHNEEAALPDAESLTTLSKGYEKIDFSFPDLNKKLVTPADDRFKGKVLVIQILGTWCPNCMDEINFLSPWYKKNKDRGVEILGLAYERKPDFEYAKERVKKMEDKLGITYEILIAGVNDNAKVAASLPALNGFVGFPTTIFVGKDGKVKRIHAGFSGPGTGIYYEKFIQRYNEIINELLAENNVAKNN